MMHIFLVCNVVLSLVTLRKVLYNYVAGISFKLEPQHRVSLEYIVVKRCTGCGIYDSMHCLHCTIVPGHHSCSSLESMCARIIKYYTMYRQWLTWFCCNSVRLLMWWESKSYCGIPVMFLLGLLYALTTVVLSSFVMWHSPLSGCLMSHDTDRHPRFCDIAYTCILWCCLT